MVQLLEQKVDLTGYSVADLIVGKAVAFLFVKAKIKAVYAKVISRQGLKILNQYHIDCEYDNLTEQIINREKQIFVQWKKQLKMQQILKKPIY